MSLPNTSASDTCLENMYLNAGCTKLGTQWTNNFDNMKTLWRGPYMHMLQDVKNNLDFTYRTAKVDPVYKARCGI